MMHTTRLLLVVSTVLAIAACTSQIDQSKFAAIYHSGQAIKTSTSIGVTNSKYRSLLQTFATEVNIAKAKPQDAKERQMMRYYVEALKNYEQAAKTWSALLKVGDYNGGLKLIRDISWKRAGACIVLASNIYDGKSSNLTISSTKHTKKLKPSCSF